MSGRRLASCNYKFGDGYGSVDLACPYQHIGYTGELRRSKWKANFTAHDVGSSIRESYDAKVEIYFFEDWIANEFLARTLAELANGTPGTIEINGWEQRCYVIDADPNMQRKTFVSYTLTMRMLDGFWSHKSSYVVTNRKASIGDSLDYPYDAPYDLAPYVDDGAVEVPAGGPRVPYPLTIRFQGPCSSPAVIIDGNRYEVDTDVPYNGELVLDGPSLSAKMYVRGELYGDVTGRAVRGLGEGRGRYAFQPLERQGRSVVRLDNCDRATVTVHEMRGEPPWC